MLVLSVNRPLEEEDEEALRRRSIVIRHAGEELRVVFLNVNTAGTAAKLGFIGPNSFGVLRDEVARREGGAS